MSVFLITGASAGIGRHLALTAIAMGNEVIVNARRSEPLEELKKIAPDRVRIVVGDLTDLGVQDLLAKSVEEFGHLDYLINNAGYGHHGPLEKHDGLEDMIQLNLTALIQMTRKMLPFLKKAKKGRILNIASVMGEVELPFFAVYVATKYAVVGFSRALNLELAGTRVRASAVCPAGVRTEFAGRALRTEIANRINSSFGMSEPVERVVQGIWRRKDCGCSVVHPTIMAKIQGHGGIFFRRLLHFILEWRVARKGENYF